MYMCICMYIVHISIYNSRVDGDDVPPRLVADPVEGVEGRISTVSSQTGKILYKFKLSFVNSSLISSLSSPFNN